MNVTEAVLYGRYAGCRHALWKVLESLQEYPDLHPTVIIRTVIDANEAARPACTDEMDELYKHITGR